MRRKDREITEEKVIEEFIAQQKILRVAFYDDGDIYIVPVNYGYIKVEGMYTFYFHGAKAGRKYDLAKEEPMVGFEIDGNYQLMEGTIACEYSAHYQSIVGNGRLYPVDDQHEKIRALNAVMKQNTGKDAWEYEPAMLDSTAVFRLEVVKMSCKAR